MRRTLLAPSLIAVVAALSLTACSGSNSGSGTSSAPASTESAEESSGTASSQPSTTASSPVTAAQERLVKYVAGTFTEPPTEGPAPASAANVWVISCAQASEGCAQATAGAMEASDLLGWNTTVFDGKFDPNAWNNGIRQAISSKASAIVLASIDCAPVQQALQEAKEAGIKIYGFYAFDCNDPSVGGTALFDGSTDFGAGYGQDYGAFLEDYGRADADWVIANTDGKAKIILFEIGGYLFQPYISKGFKDRLAEACPDCEIVDTVPYLATDLGPNLTSKVQSALLKHPDANVVAAHIDAAMGSVAPAVLQARADRPLLLAQGGEGLTASFDLIRDDKGQDMLNSGSPAWMGWSAIDGVNRLLNGVSVAPSGMGFQIVDRSTNLPSAGTAYTPPIDFRAAYRQAWGL